MLSILVWNSVRLISTSHIDLLKHNVEKQTVLIANILAPGLATNDRALIIDNLNQISNDKQVVYAQVYDDNSLLIASSGQNIDISETDFLSFEAAKRTGVYSIKINIALYGQKLGLLKMGYSIKYVEQLTNKTITQNTSIAITEILLSIFMAVIAGYLLTKSLRKLEEATKALSRDELDYRINLNSNDEIGDLAQSFDKLAEHLAQTRNSLIDEHRLLQEREQNLAITLNSIGDAVITTDANGNVTRMNMVAEKMTGWSFLEAEGKTLKSIFPIINASTRQPIDSPVDKVLATGKIIHLSNHTTLISKDGSEFQITDSAAPIQDADGFILGMILVFNDVTEQYYLRQKAMSVQKQMQETFDDMQTMVSALDVDGTVNFINNTLLKLSGIESSDVIGEKLWNCFWFKHSKELQENVEDSIFIALKGEVVKKDIQIQIKNGLLWIEIIYIPKFNIKGEVVQLVTEARDISDRKIAEATIEHQAHYDYLTDLPNRFLILDRLCQLTKEAKRNNGLIGILFLDIDDFKKVNDTLGHEFGDKVLMETSSRLKNIIREEDTAGRLGGDEFVILLKGLESVNDARIVAENILHRIQDAFNINNKELLLTTSIGISIYPNDGKNPSDLLKHADSAMYHAKGLGRNTYSYFTTDINFDISRRLSIEEQMRGAIDRGEFEVYYQPKIEISSGKIMGAEALLRWSNSALGNIFPDEFIPIAEHTGLIVPIGQFVINEAFKTTAQWHTNFDQSFCIAVNLSPRQFKDKALVASIKEAMKKHNLSNECVELEITEGILMGNHAYIKDALLELDALGINISMDDFGTGYSSLSYLRKYPFDILKIDRSFISDITVDQGDKELVNAAISMAHSLNLKVVAEGIETKEQLSLLKDMECEYGQGYLFSKPVPKNEMSEILRLSKSIQLN